MEKEQHELENRILKKYYLVVTEYLSSAKHIERHFISNGTKTTEMTTNLRRGFYNDGKIFEIRGRGTSVKVVKKPLDLYIINSKYILIYRGRLDVAENIPVACILTATEFKQKRFLYRATLSQKPEMLVELQNGMKVRLYEKPVMLCCQTEYDKDYRKEWYYGSLEYEGNNYGDTSKFYFVGEVV